jgi:hypothetical protein
MRFFPIEQVTPIPCGSCGELFTPGSPRSLYCSLTCRQRAKRHRRRANTPLTAHNRHQRKIAPFFAIMDTPTLFELNVTCEEFIARADRTQSIYVRNKPEGFILPPGLRHHEFGNTYKVAFQ